jgi:hypothetical protein
VSPKQIENEIMKRNLIWIAVAAVAIPLALPVINANAQCPDDQPRLGETTAEYTARMAHCALGELRAIRGATERIDKRYENALADAERIARENERIAREQRERARRAHEVYCNRLSQRAANVWKPSYARLYEDYCAD